MKAPKLIIAPSETNSDVFYATHFLAPSNTFLLQMPSGKKIMITNTLEYGRAKKTATVDEVILDDELVPKEPFKEKCKKEGIPFSGMEQTIEGITLILKDALHKEVTVPWNFPLKAFKLLERRGIEVSYTNSFFPEREIKTAQEHEWIREAQRVNELGMTRAIEMIAESRIKFEGGLLYHRGSVLISEMVKDEIHKVFWEHGYLAPIGSIVACGDQCCDPHNDGSGPLKANQTIIIDLFPRSMKTRFFADMTRTVVKGKASKEVKRMYEAVQVAKSIAKNEIKDGVVANSVYERIKNFFEHQGFPIKVSEDKVEGFIHGVGHGFGLDIHEDPLFAMSDNTLKAGSVVTIEPGLYYYGVGGVRLEDFVIITEDGCKTVTTFPEVLEIP